MVDIARLVVRLEAENSKLTKALSKSTKDVKRFDSSVKKAARSARQSFSGLFAGLATSFEKLDAQLETVSGSAEAAAEAMVGIQSIAATVPFSIQEVTDSFIKLKAFGLDPSREALTSYANTASAMGRSGCG